MRAEPNDPRQATPKCSAVIEWGSLGRNKLKRIQTVWEWVIFTRSRASRSSRSSDLTLGELVSTAHVEGTPMSNQITTDRWFVEIDDLFGGRSRGDEGGN